MKIRAAIFDVYGTLLEVGPPPSNGDARWEKLFQDTFQTKPTLSRLDFSVACNRAIARRHTEARARGIPFPEIVWPSIVMEVIPALGRLTAPAQAEFIFGQIRIGRTTRLQSGAGYALQLLTGRGCVLGIASNAQAYTLRELQEALAGTGTPLDRFERDLRVWSFEQGFSKPDPHVFQMVVTRLEARGISAAETVMIGDRLDNDIAPARAHGLQTWHLTSSPDPATKSGNWGEFAKRLQHGW